MVLSRRESKYDKGPMDLRNTCLSETNLREADFSGTNLSGADLRGTNLSGVNLFGANLREADLRRAYWLTQPQINSALGDAKTQLPDTLKKAFRRYCAKMCLFNLMGRKHVPHAAPKINLSQNLI
jgi:hypothetical protein